MSGLTIEMLPAGPGDAFWIEWGPDDDRHRMVIDGGKKGKVHHLRDRLTNRVPNGQVDLLVVTHIDADHIEAPIELLLDPVPGIEFGDIWFNDYNDLAPPPTPPPSDDGVRGPAQGESLNALIEGRELPSNLAFGGGPVMVDDGDGPLPVIECPAGLTLVLLSPTKAKLTSLEKTWKRKLEKKKIDGKSRTPGNASEALALLKDDLEDFEELDSALRGGGGPVKWGSDPSTANGSSIAFILQYGTDRWLFSGDAHDDVLQASLRRYAAHHDTERDHTGSDGNDHRVRLDGFKVSHHGSAKNISAELLDMIDCSCFLISTKGGPSHNHPEPACIDLIIEKSTDTKLVFNYLTPGYTDKWIDIEGVTSIHLYGENDEPINERVEGDDTDRSIDLVEPIAPGDLLATHSEVHEEAPQDEHESELDVFVYHGSLDRAHTPVLIGHYEATPLSGAEYYINQRFGGRLADRHVLGGYPGKIGSHLLVDAPRGSQPTEGVIIVGLGEYGELTPLLLTETVRSALVSYGLFIADVATDWAGEEEDDGSIWISSLLVGATGEQGLGVRAAARAVVEGVVEANRSLKDRNGETDWRFTQLDVWERGAAEAEVALRALRPSGDDSEALPPGVAVESSMLMSGGALRHSLPADADERPWRRISVTAAHDEHEEPEGAPVMSLRFASNSRRAGVEDGIHRIERRRIERLLREGASKNQLDESFYTTLYELLLPNGLKGELRAAADLQIEVDDRTADIPWEMLHARSPGRTDRKQLALRAPFTRQLRVVTTSHIERAKELRALVIGNPPAGVKWNALQGAYDEANAVVAALEPTLGLDAIERHIYAPGHDVDGAIVADIEGAFFNNEYRIVHIAGHGSYDAEDETSTGVVIGPETFITAQFIGQMRPVPDLVFLNCCHLGQIDAGPSNPAEADFNRLGASLARTLIRAGVRAVVSAGWAVKDDAAEAFATTFYSRMIEHAAPFGQAVFEARKAAYERDRTSNTWGAYQCYGDSGLQLVHTGSASSSAGRSSSPVPGSTREMLRRIELIADGLPSTGIADWSPERRAAVEEELEDLATALEDLWSHSIDGGRIAEALARVHAEMGNFDTAIDFYDEALWGPSGTGSIGAMEERAGLNDQIAAKLMTDGETSSEKVAEAWEWARGEIEDLTTFRGDDRSGLMGRHHQRRAALLKGSEQAAELKAASDAYFEVLEEVDTLAVVYIRHIQIETLRDLSDPDYHSRVTNELRSALEEHIAELETRSATQVSYADLITPLDYSLARAIEQGGDEFEDTVMGLTDGYVDAIRKGSTAIKRDSTLEHIDDLAKLHPDADARSALTKMVAAIRSGATARTGRRKGAPR